MSVEKIMEMARDAQESLVEADSSRREEARAAWAARLAQMLDEETWRDLGIVPDGARIGDSDSVISVDGELRGITGLEGEPLGVRVSLPMVQPRGAELVLSVAPHHGTFRATLWSAPGSTHGIHDGEIREGRPSPEAVEAAKRDNVLRIGRTLLKFVEYRDRYRVEVEMEPLANLLFLVGPDIPGGSVPALSEIAGWTAEEREEVAHWASSGHRAASDNDDVEVPEMPEVLRRLADD